MPNEIISWHNLSYMKFLFLNMNKKVIDDFHCDTCYLAKQVRSSYPPKPYIPSQPFNLIHSDIWSPSKFETNSKARCFVTFIDDRTR